MLDKKKTRHSLVKKRRWFILRDGAIYYFERKTSSKSLGKIQLSDIKDITVNGRSFVIQTSTRDYFLAADTVELCEEWITHINHAMSPFYQFEAEQKRSARAELFQSRSFNLCGELYKLGVSGGFKKRYFEYMPEEHTLSYMIAPGKPSLGRIHLDKVLSLKRGSSRDGKNHERLFRMVTPGRIFVLRADTEDMCELWYDTLLTEIEFIKNMTQENRNPLEETHDLDQKISGALLKREYSGVLRKRWLLFDEKRACLYIFTSHRGLEYSTDSPISKEIIDRVIPLETIAFVEGIKKESASVFKIKREEVRLYFRIRTIKAEDILFLCPTPNMKKNWVDALQIEKESLEVTESFDDILSDMPSSVLSEKRSSACKRMSLALSMGINELALRELNHMDVTHLKDCGKDVCTYCIHEDDGDDCIQVTQVETDFASLHHKNVFVVDAGSVIYQWNGKAANRLMKAKGLDIASTIKFKEREGTADIKVIDSAWEEKDEHLQEAHRNFWALFGGIENEVKVPGDETSKKKKKTDAPKFSLYRVSRHRNVEKSITLVKIPKGEKPHKDILNTRNNYVLQTNESIMVWIGERTLHYQKQTALVLAEHLLRELNKDWVKIEENKEGSESVMWKEQFNDYANMLPIKESSESTFKDALQCPVDIPTLLNGNVTEYVKENIPFTEMTLFKTQSLKIWRVHKFKLCEYPENLYGQFYSDDSFIILLSWSTEQSPATQHILFTWQGRGSSQHCRTTSALLTVGLDDSMDGEALQIRIEQNKEPSEFLMLFESYIVHMGSFDYRPSRQRLYDVRGSTLFNLRAIEVETNQVRLNSLHCYVLTPKDESSRTFVWKGARSLDIEQDYATKVASTLSPEVYEILDGQDDEDFFAVLGCPRQHDSRSNIDSGTPVPGTSDAETNRLSSSSSSLSIDPSTHLPRLFVCTQSDTFKCEEEKYVCQDQFQNGCCYILMTSIEVGELFVWLTSSANDFIKRNTLITAHFMIEYLKDQGYSNAYVVYGGRETSDFYQNIHGWCTVGTQTRRSTIVQSQARIHNQIPLDQVMKLYCGYNTYPYSVLLQKELPEGVDPSKLETYLSEGDFHAVFDVSKQEFYRYPEWKQKELKSKVYLL